MLIDVRKIAERIKRGGATVTSVVSSMLKVVSPQWGKAVATWDGWKLTKRGIAIGVLAGAGLLVWTWGVDLSRLTVGSYRSAYAYGHGQSVTKSDISGMVHMSDISRIQRQVDEIKSQLSKIDDTIDKAQASRITTGSIPKKKASVKKPARKPASSWFDLP